MSDVTINIMIKKMKKYKKFITEFSKNQLSKDNYVNFEKMNKKKFDIYLIELEEELNKYNLDDEFKKIFLIIIKKIYESTKNDNKKFTKNENYILAKNEIDLLIYKKKDLKKKYNFYMNEIEKIYIYYKLNLVQIYNLIKYFYEKASISRREQSIFQFKRLIKSIDELIKKLKEKKELQKKTNF